MRKQHSQQRVTALLVIDVQKGLFEKSTPIHKADQVLENINHLIGQARQKNMPVIFIQHSNSKTLEKGSTAWQLHPQIQPREEEVVIHKLHGNAFEETNLREELEKRNVSVVVITGLVTHGCVKATCLGALKEGYKVVLVSDGHSSYSKDAAQLIEKWNRALHEKGADLIETQKVRFSSN
ncbi:MAG: cysteine hydrolase family protein [Chloroflexota bacterium]